MDWNTAHSFSQRSNWGPRIRSIFYSFSIGEALDQHRRYWHYRLISRFASIVQIRKDPSNGAYNLIAKKVISTAHVQSGTTDCWIYRHPRLGGNKYLCQSYYRPKGTSDIIVYRPLQGWEISEIHNNHLYNNAIGQIQNIIYSLS